MIINFEVDGKNEVKNADCTISTVYTLKPSTQSDTALTVQGQVTISTANNSYASAYNVGDVVTLTISK